MERNGCGGTLSNILSEDRREVLAHNPLREHLEFALEDYNYFLEHRDTWHGRRPVPLSQSLIIPIVFNVVSNLLLFHGPVSKTMSFTALSIFTSCLDSTSRS